MIGPLDLRDLNQPTPWPGATERLAQYAFEVWQGALAVMLLARRGSPGEGEGR